MAIDTLDKLIKAEPEFADEDDDFKNFPIREDLSWYARKTVELLASKARGIELITGHEGGGKDLYAASTASIYKYCMGRRILLDFKPKSAFGGYTLLDTWAIIHIVKELAKAWGVDGIEGSSDNKEVAQFMVEATIKWLLEGPGFDLFKGAVWYISELKKVAFNRNSQGASNKFIGTVCTVWRHLDLLLMGTHVKENEIDVKAFLEYAKLRTFCRQTCKRGVIKATVVRGIYTGADFVVAGTEGMLKPLVFIIDGNEPRDFLGGKRFFDLYTTKRMSF